MCQNIFLILFHLICARQGFTHLMQGTVFLSGGCTVTGTLGPTVLQPCAHASPLSQIPVSVLSSPISLSQPVQEQKKKEVKLARPAKKTTKAYMEIWRACSVSFWERCQRAAARVTTGDHEATGTVSQQ